MNLAAPLTDKANALECLGYCEQSYVSTSLNTGGAHVNIVQLDGCIVISARGSDSAEDWIHDSEFLMCDTIYGSVHTGFWESTSPVIPLIREKLRALPPLPIIGTGHSLGGDQISLIAIDLATAKFPLDRVITFGQARPGGSDFKAWYDRLLGLHTVRFVNARDLVPRCPLAEMGYVNVGQEAFLPSTGGMEMNPTFLELLHDDVVGGINDIKSGRVELIADHLLTNYRSRVEALSE